MRKSYSTYLPATETQSKTPKENWAKCSARTPSLPPRLARLEVLLWTRGSGHVEIQVWHCLLGPDHVPRGGIINSALQKRN